MSASNRKGITVRFEDHEMDKLEQLAARYHVSSATIIRWALKALGEYVEANNGRIILPLDFSTFCRDAVKRPPATPVVITKVADGECGSSADAAHVKNGKYQSSHESGKR